MKWPDSVMAWHAIRRLTWRRVYHGALIRDRLWQYAIGMLAMVWTCIALLGYFAVQQVYTMLESNRQGTRVSEHRFGEQQLSKPPQGLDVPMETLQPAKVLPLMRAAEAMTVEGLFHLKNVETSAPVTAINHPIDSPAFTPDAVPLRQPAWQLQIQRPSLIEASVKHQLANAQYQLLAGNFELARQSFEHILLQDPHQVVALAGMLVVISQRGEIRQREGYLRRLRQEIPDYVPDEDLFLLQVAD